MFAVPNARTDEPERRVAVATTGRRACRCRGLRRTLARGAGGRDRQRADVRDRTVRAARRAPTEPGHQGSRARRLRLRAAGCLPGRCECRRRAHRPLQARLLRARDQAGRRCRERDAGLGQGPLGRSRHARVGGVGPDDGRGQAAGRALRAQPRSSRRREHGRSRRAGASARDRLRRRLLPRPLRQLRAPAALRPVPGRGELPDHARRPARRRRPRAPPAGVHRPRGARPVPPAGRGHARSGGHARAPGGEPRDLRPQRRRRLRLPLAVALHDVRRGRAPRARALVLEPARGLRGRARRAAGRALGPLGRR